MKNQMLKVSISAVTSNNLKRENHNPGPCNPVNVLIQPATYVVSCFQQTSRRLLELSQILFLSPNELTVVK